MRKENNLKTNNKMKTVSVHCFDKHSGAVFTETVMVSHETLKPDKDRIKKRLDEIFANVPFVKWYYEAETFDDLTDEELKIFEELDVEVI